MQQRNRKNKNHINKYNMNPDVIFDCLIIWALVSIAATPILLIVKWAIEIKWYKKIINEIDKKMQKESDNNSGGR